jgi:hypothetical protein
MAVVIINIINMEGILVTNSNYTTTTMLISNSNIMSALLMKNH